MQIYGVQMFRVLKMQLRYMLGLEKDEKGSPIPVKIFLFLPRRYLKGQYSHNFLYLFIQKCMPLKYVFICVGNLDKSENNCISVNPVNSVCIVILFL